MYAYQAFTWRSIPDASIYTGTNYNATNLAEGDYELIVTNSTYGCSSQPDTATVDRSGDIPDVTIQKLSDQLSCNPPDGSLKAILATPDGTTTGYTFSWYNEALEKVATGVTATGLPAGNYTVEAEKDGCTKASEPVVHELGE